MSKLRNPFQDTMLLMKAVPDLATRFATAPTVPDSHVHGDTLTCVCGAVTALQTGRIIECEGYCGRHFLDLPDGVRACMLGSTRNVDLAA